ncbi:Lysosome-associated membrane glycoprotein 1 [Liparis tanakae]|uniref:Lysosome-associated membrane glycoprotein 1 n=1 Tax=Liparis tanakae TaxID=230148 RepID=A0A4Z2GI64_9TELE|nr:Lysosome-associated membrane glycoprotein 1 [Liparis tanakae]
MELYLEMETERGNFRSSELSSISIGQPRQEAFSGMISWSGEEKDCGQTELWRHSRPSTHSPTLLLIVGSARLGYRGKEKSKDKFIEYNKKTWYFPLEPSRVRTSGYCGKEAAVLSLALPHGAASLQFTFREDKSVFYVDKLTAHVSPLPVCRGCANKTYSGALAHEKLFAAGHGQSFKCQSEQLLWTSSELSIRLVPLRLQAFTLPAAPRGSEVECWPDFNKRALPIIAEATGLGLFLIAVMTFLFIKDRRREGYDRL